MMKIRALAPIAVATLALAACGGDDSTQIAVEAPPVTATPVVQPIADPVVEKVAGVEDLIEEPETEAETGSEEAEAPETTLSPVATIAVDEDAVELDSGEADTGLRGIAFNLLQNAGLTDADAGCVADALDYDDPRILEQDPAVIDPAFEACGLEPLDF